MTQESTFESFSTITKEEKVKTLNHSIIPNTFCLEIISPLPGYYGSEYLIDQNQPGHILFLTKDYVHFEDFFRMVKRMKTYMDMNFDASLASVEVHNSTVSAIRVRNISSYEDVSELQQAFMAEGVSMAKPRRIADKAIIRIKKFLMLKELEAGIYSDREVKGYYYLSMKHPVSWKLFEKVTHRIRHNNPELKYDVAFGVLFRTGDLEDIIRVYGESLSSEELITLHTQYTKALSEYI
jgi:hypothetical protein